MDEQFPDGYDCDGLRAEQPGHLGRRTTRRSSRAIDNPGVEATIEGVEGITGLEINYYAMVNLQGFRSMVAGGRRAQAERPRPHPDRRRRRPGHRATSSRACSSLNGFQTLWFARSRESADDYSRMARQKCVMNAMLQQLSPQTVVTKFEKIAKASEELVTTDLPASELGTVRGAGHEGPDPAGRARSRSCPRRSTPASPTSTKMQSMVKQAIDALRGRKPRPTPGASGRPRPPRAKASKARKGYSAASTTVGGSIGNLHDGYAANESTDLSSAC